MACESCTAPPSYLGKSSMTGGVQPEMEEAPVPPSPCVFLNTSRGQRRCHYWHTQNSGIGSVPYMRPRSSGAVSTVMGRPSGIGSSRPTVVICSRPGSGDNSGELVWVMRTSGLDFGSGEKGGAALQIHFWNGEGWPLSPVSPCRLVLTKWLADGPVTPPAPSSSTPSKKLQLCGLGNGGSSGVFK